MTFQKTNNTTRIKTTFILIITALFFVAVIGSQALAVAKQKSFQEAYLAYEKALSAKTEIEQAIANAKKSVEELPNLSINYDDYKNDPSIVNNWISQYNTSLKTLSEARTTYFPVFTDYQTKLDSYNNSGFAPDENPKIAFKAEDAFSDIDNLVASLNTEMDQNITHIKAYQKFYQAKITLEKEYAEYKKAWEPNNPGDPDDKVNNEWPNIINTYGNEDFTEIGFPTEIISQMNTKDDLIKVIDTYEEKTKKVELELTAYHDYLYEVSDKWQAAKDKFDIALGDFNTTTGNSVTVHHFSDYLKVGADGMLRLAQTAPVSNTDWMRKTIDWYYEGDSVYDHLVRFKSAIIVSLGAGGTNYSIINTENNLSITPITTDFNVSPIEIYEPISSNDSGIEVPNTGERRQK